MAVTPWASLIGPLERRVAVTPGSTAFAAGPCRVVIVSADCLLNVTECDGTDVDDVQFFKGYNPYVVSKIRTGSGESGITIEIGY